MSDYLGHRKELCPPNGTLKKCRAREAERLLRQIRNYQEALGWSSVRRSTERQRKHLKLAIRKQLSPASTFSKLICHESRLMKAARLTSLGKNSA
jgi:hypothetical protein